MSPSAGKLSFAVALVALGGCLSASELEPSTSTGFRIGSTRYRKPLRSWKELSEENVVKQGADYSCGAASLATLMHHYFGDPVTEQVILTNILASLTDVEVEDREQNGFSLLDLKEYAERRGYQAVGVRMKYASLPKLKGPVLLHVDRKGNNHFVVLRGVHEDRIYLADPSWGNIRMSIDRFAKEWTGVGLILGKKGFGLPEEYPLALDEFDRVRNEDLMARRALYTRP